MVDLCPDRCSHRIRLTCEEQDTLVTALNQYISGKGGKRKTMIAGLLRSRFIDRAPGNPHWIQGEFPHVHRHD